MKKLIALLTLLVLLLPATPVFAQVGTNATGAPGAWVSSINIQNPTASPADVLIAFYDASGTLVKNFTVPTIAANGSVSIYVPSGVSDLAAGQYSSVVSSSVEVNIVVNSSSTVPSTAGAYSGFKSEETGASLFFPGLYKDYYTFNSEIVLQNVSGTAAADVSIQFYNQKTGLAVGAPIVDSIPANAAETYKLGAIAALPTGSSGLFAAKVTSTQPLAGIANIWSPTKFGEMSQYNAFVNGTATAYVPALYKNYYGFVSSLTVQNLDATAQTITVTYSDGTTDTAVVAANAAVEFYQPSNAALPSGNSAGVFSAKVTTTGTKIVALTNVEDKTKGSLASYNGVSTPTDSVLCPVVMKEYYNWFTAETVQNVGAIATDVTVTYANGATRTLANVAPGSTVNVIELTSAGSVLANGASLAASFTSSNAQPLVVVVQENSNTRYSATPGDYLLAYSCNNN